jgi:hypothetical protein
MSPLEKVARAISAANKAAPFPWWSATPENCRLSAHLARAALTALLDPDEGTIMAMLDAHASGQPFESPFGPNGSFVGEFNAAIQHILKGAEG